MDDLISRKRITDEAKRLSGPMTGDGWDNWGVYALIERQPSVPAVPLDKLCEWLANSFSDPPCCTLENVQCKMECRGFTQMDYSECWRHVLTKWMEGLDGIESMVQKT